MARRLGKVGLTDRQRRFAEEYLVDFNATQAAIRAGYSIRTADRIGSKLRRLPEVQARVAAHNEQVGRELGLTAKRLEEELAAVAFFDPLDIVDPGTGSLLPIERWPERARRVLQGWDEEPIFADVPTGATGPRGAVVTERRQVGVRRKVRWAPKVEALALGMKRLGMLTEKHELVGPANVTVNIGTRRKPETPATASAGRLPSSLRELSGRAN